MDQSLGMSLSSDKTQKAAWPRTAVLIAAWIEIIVGISFILALNGQSQLIFGTTTEGSGVHFAQLAGIALISLGIACLPSSDAATQRVAARSLLIYNIAATIFFAWIGVATTLRGIVLWPVVILHTLLAIVLGMSLSWIALLQVPLPEFRARCVAFLHRLGRRAL